MFPKITSGKVPTGLSLTEQDTGSGLKNVVTTMRRDGDRLLRSGNNSFVCYGGAAGFCSVLAAEDDTLSLFLVPADAPGLTISFYPGDP